MKEAKTFVPFVLLVGVAGALMYGTHTRGHEWGGDFAGYVMQAESLANGAPGDYIEANGFTMGQSSYALGPVAYPWGFPVMLAPVYAVFGLNMIALKMVGVLSYLLFLVLLWFGFRRLHSPAWFLCLVCLFALNPGMLAFSNNILSDLPFLFFSTLSIVLIGAVVVGGRRFISGFWDSVLIGIAVAIAYSIRTVGALLLVSLAVSQVVSYLQSRSQNPQRYEKEPARPVLLRYTPSIGNIPVKPLFVNLMPYAVVLISVVVWKLALPEAGEYPLPGLETISPVSFAKQVYYYLGLPSEFFAGVPYPQILYGASIPLVVVGMIRRHRSEYPAIVYMGLTVIPYVILPWRQGLRYLFPILPFYVSFMLSGLESFRAGSAAADRRLRALISFVPVLLVIFSFGYSSAFTAYKNIRGDRIPSTGPYTTASQSMFSFIAGHTDKKSTIVFFKPRVMRLMTKRNAIAITKVEELCRGDYICLYPSAGSINQLPVDAVENLARNGTAHLVYENNDFRVYRLRPCPSGAPDS